MAKKAMRAEVRRAKLANNAKASTLHHKERTMLLRCTTVDCANHAYVTLPANELGQHKRKCKEHFAQVLDKQVKQTELTALIASLGF